jgi:hypothetical protein
MELNEETAAALIKEQTCCGKAMDVDYGGINGEISVSATCLECGSFVYITMGQLDDDELADRRGDDFCIAADGKPKYVDSKGVERDAKTATESPVGTKKLKRWQRR